MKTLHSLPVIEEISFTNLHEDRPVALFTTASAWAAVRDRLSLKITWESEVHEADEESWRSSLADLTGKVVYAVGGGLAVDAGKFTAAAKNLPLVCLPTALSVDAFLTPVSGVRKDGCITYIETKCPEKLIIDYEVLASAPEHVRAAGICDLLSIATGLWDWKYAEGLCLNTIETHHTPYIEQVAQGILQGALDCSEAAGNGEMQGLRQLLVCLAMEVQLCNLIGHSRPEEGSEHYFAYSVENVIGTGVPHGDLVGPGILLIAMAQGLDVEPLRNALEACRVPLDRIPREVITSVLRGLPDYCRRHRLPHGIAHDLTEDRIDDVLRAW
jgi:glycerol-1-phosphate dehydrogenase [NAD(P)+]